MWWIRLASYTGRFLGISSLGAFFGSLVAKLIEWFGKKAARTIALKTLIIAGLITITATVLIALTVIFNSISLVLPSELTQAFTMFLPDNFRFCVSTIFAAKTLMWTHAWHIDFIDKYMKTIQ